MKKKQTASDDNACKTTKKKQYFKSNFKTLAYLFSIKL